MFTTSRCKIYKPHQKLVCKLTVEASLIFYYLKSFFLTIQARSKGVSDTVVGLIFGTYPFVVFVSSPFFGVLVSKFMALCYQVDDLHVHATVF